jgi:hypothetical protein
LSLLDEALLTRGVLRAKNCMHQTAARTGFFLSPLLGEGKHGEGFCFVSAGAARSFSLLLVGTIKKIIPPGDLR